MPNKSDKMEEERRRQNELIELKKIRQAGGSLPNPDKSLVLTTPEQKRAHFWYYYKWYVIALVLVAVALGIMVKDCCSKIDYDYTLLLNSTEFVSDEISDRVADAVTPLAVDVNGDGEVHLMIDNCSRGTNQYDYNNAQATRFQSKVFEGKARIFIVNREIFDQFNTAELNLWSDAFRLPDCDGKALNIKNTSLAPLFMIKEDEYYLCYRISDSYDTADALLFKKIVAEITK